MQTRSLRECFIFTYPNGGKKAKSIKSKEVTEEPKIFIEENHKPNYA
jgi:hypothetical protein